MRGLLVRTPLIGAFPPALVDGVDRAEAFDLRVKPEVLQPGGSIHFRGALHQLLRRLGAWRGVALVGSVPAVVAGAQAAALLRVPRIAFPDGEPSRAAWRRLQALECETRPRPSLAAARQAAEELRAARGYGVLAGVEDADYALGVATVGLELAAQLPADCRRVVIAPAELAGPVAHGLAAGGGEGRVEGVAVEGVEDPEKLREAVAETLRLCVGRASLAALSRALRAPKDGSGACAVLSA